MASSEMKENDCIQLILLGRWKLNLATRDKSVKSLKSPDLNLYFIRCLGCKNNLGYFTMNRFIFENNFKFLRNSRLMFLMSKFIFFQYIIFSVMFHGRATLD